MPKYFFLGRFLIMMFVVRVLRTARHIRGAEIKRIMALAVDQ